MKSTESHLNIIMFMKNIDHKLFLSITTANKVLFIQFHILQDKPYTVTEYNRHSIQDKMYMHVNISQDRQNITNLHVHVYVYIQGTNFYYKLLRF